MSLITLPAGAIDEVSLTLPADLTFCGWQDVGRQLGRAERSVMWWIGDWWAFGEHRYGARKAIVTAPDWNGPTYNSCVEAARVARRFPPQQRQVNLAFAHHQEVAALPQQDAAKALSRAAAEGLSARDLRAEVGKLRDADADAERAAEMKKLAEAGETRIRDEVARASDERRRPSRRNILGAIPSIAERPPEVSRFALWLRTGADLLRQVGDPADFAALMSRHGVAIDTDALRDVATFLSAMEADA